MRPTILSMVEDDVRELVETFTGDPSAGPGQTLDRDRWDLAGLVAELSKIFPIPDTEKPETWRNMTVPELADHLVALAEQVYDAKEAALGSETMRQLGRLVMLRHVDSRWVRHLTDLDELREGIGLRAFAQQDPLISYQREAHDMYQELVAAISHDIVNSIYHAQFLVRPTLPVQRMQTNRGEGSAPQTVRSGKTLGRNDPCWCGSGKKYKHCHLRADQGRAENSSSAKRQQTAAVAVGGPPPAGGTKSRSKKKKTTRRRR